MNVDASRFASHTGELVEGNAMKSDCSECEGEPLPDPRNVGALVRRIRDDATAQAQCAEYCGNSNTDCREMLHARYRVWRREGYHQWEEEL